MKNKIIGIVLTILIVVLGNAFLAALLSIGDPSTKFIEPFIVFLSFTVVVCIILALWACAYSLMVHDKWPW